MLVDAFRRAAAEEADARSAAPNGGGETAPSAAPDGRSVLVEQIRHAAPAGDASTAPTAARSHAGELSTSAPQGRSVLFEQLRAAAASPDDASSLSLQVSASAPRAASPEGRSALDQQIRTDVGEGAAWRALRPGDVLGRFELLRELGRGGFGIVFEARDRELGRSVAVKAVRPGRRDSRIETILLEEAASAARLQHENIVSLFDYGQSATGPYLVLELLRGETLASRIGRGPLPFPEALRIAIGMARGIVHAHAAGLLHRDLKPANVFLTEGGGVKVMDLGLAHLVRESRGSSGTPAYMSPEQWRGEKEDARTDVFALGVTVFEMLTGRRPYEVEGRHATVLDPGPEPPLSIPRAPPRLVRLVQRCIAKAPDERPATAQEVLGELVAVERAPERLTRALAAVALALLVAIVGGGTAWRLWPRPPPPKPQTLLVGDFENRTGDHVFDGSLEPALTVALEGASFVTAFSRGNAQRIAAQLKLPGAGLAEERARLVAQREGIGIVTAGYVAREGSGYRIGVRAVDAFTGQRIVDRAEPLASKDDALPAVTKLAARVRRALGDATPVGVQLKEGETFSATSLDAAHAYGLATRLALEGNWEEAKREYLRAIGLDPGLARAHSGLAVLESNRGRRADADRHFGDCMTHMDRMSEREKHRSRGAFYLHSRDPDQAIAAFEALIRQFPADYAGHANLALAYAFRREFPRALDEARRAIAIYPRNVPQRNNVGFFAMYAGAFDEAVQEQERVLEENPRFGNGHIGLALAQLAAGRRDAALSTWGRYRALGGADASSAVEGLADLALYEGRISEARALLEPALARDVAAKASDSAARKLVMIAEAHLAAGERTRSAAAAQRALAAGASDYVLFQAAMVLAQLGEREAGRAAAIADDLEKRLEPEKRMFAELVRGTIELRTEGRAHGIEHLKSAVQRLDSWLARFALGRAYLEAGAFPQAQDELEKCEKRRGEATDVFIDNVPTYRLYPAVRYYLGRTHEALSSPAAGDWYRSFLAVKRGDEDSMVADARHRLALR